MKYLYKYPQGAFPYMDLIQTNRNRSRYEFEYELIDTGIFNQNRYYDVFVEYAKQTPEDLLVQITVHNRGPERAVLHLLPTIWFRNTWWMSGDGEGSRPQLKAVDAKKNIGAVAIKHAVLGEYTLYSEGDAPCYSPKTRPTSSAFLAFRTQPRTSRTASMNMSSTTARRPSTRSEPARKPLRITSWNWSRENPRSSACA